MEVGLPHVAGYERPGGLYRQGGVPLEDPSLFTMLELLEARHKKVSIGDVERLVRDMEQLAIERGEEETPEAATDPATDVAPPAPEPRVRRLDRITVAGSLRLARLRERVAAKGLTVLVKLIDVIADPRLTPLWGEIRNQAGQGCRNVKKCYHSHLEELAKPSCCQPY